MGPSPNKAVFITSPFELLSEVVQHWFLLLGKLALEMAWARSFRRVLIGGEVT